MGISTHDGCGDRENIGLLLHFIWVNGKHLLVEIFYNGELQEGVKAESGAIEICLKHRLL
jgi:hypothetical protein